METMMLPQDVSDVTHVPVRTLGQWRYLGKGPKYIKAHGRVLYSPEDVQRWMDEHRVDPAERRRGAA